MEFEIGIACGQCDTYSPMNTPACPACGNDLSLFAAKTERAAKAVRPRTGTNPGSKLAKLSMGAPASPSVAPADGLEGAGPATLRHGPVVEEAPDPRHS